MIFPSSHRTIVFLLPIFFYSSICKIKVQSQECLYKGTPTSDVNAAIMSQIGRKHGVNFWRHPTTNQSVLFLVKNNNTARSLRTELEASNIQIVLITCNVRRLIEDQKAGSPSFRSFSSRDTNFFESYHPLPQIEAKLMSWKSAKNDIFSLQVIGQSTEKRRIFAATIGKSQKGRSVLLECGIHAREWVSPAICLYIMNELMFSQAGQRLLDSYTFHFVPVLNPDGYAYTWNKERMWRKNRARNRGTNCFGVDLNRNFNVNFCRIGSAKDPCDETYCGRGPFSEPESRALKNFILRTHKSNPILASFHLHSYGQLVLNPPGYTKSRVSTSRQFESMGRAAANRIRETMGSVYKFGQSSTVLYPTSGGSDDWTWMATKAQAVYTIESRDTGRYGFLLPPNQIRRASIEAFTAITTILSSVR